MYDRFGPLMEDYNLFICPTLAIPAAGAEHDVRQEMKINGVPFLVCVDRLGVCRIFDPVTSELLEKSQPGRPDVLAVPGR